MRTVRHLRPSQVLWRLRYSLERSVNRRRGARGDRWAWQGSSFPDWDDDFPDLPAPHVSGPRGAAAVEKLAGGAIEHLNQEREIGWESPDWRLGERAVDRLWTITLHYHEWAHALAEVASEQGSGETGQRAAELFRHYVSDWIRRCGLERPGSAALAWNSYAIATRLGWWIRSHRHARSAIFADHPKFEDLFLRSLWQQAAYLRDHVEWDLRANHLVRDLVGLASAGRFFRNRTARGWLREASRLAPEQAAEQVLEDGGHYERSPKYHLDVMDDFLHLALLTEDDTARDALRQAWTMMAEWAACMRHPDGATPHFNDGSVVTAELVESHLRSGHRIGVDVDPKPRLGGKHFAETGLVVWHGEAWTVFFDVGPLGPDEQPGHGHADTLAIECSFKGRRLVVDPGTFGYDADERRRYDRSTQAHNTVCVDGQDSSEVWHIFRVGRRARPWGVTVEFRDGGLRACASHDGYDHLPGKPRHRRTLWLRDSHIIRIDDRISGQARHDLRGGLLIEPAWEVQPVPGGWIVSAEGHRVAIRLQGPDGLERFVEKRWYHPDYSLELLATWIGWRWRGDLPCEVQWTLEPTRWRELTCAYRRSLSKWSERESV